MIVVFAAAHVLAVNVHPSASLLKNKGPASPPTVERSVGSTHAGAAERKVHDGDWVDRDAALVAKRPTDGTGARYLFAVDGAGTRHPLLPGEGRPATIEPPGARPVTAGGEPLSLDLGDNHSPVTIVAAAAATPLPRETGMEAWPGGVAHVHHQAIRLEITP